MEGLVAFGAMSGIKKALLIFFLAFFFAFSYLVLRFFLTYANWKNEEEQILGKLISYKQELDLLRLSPLELEKTNDVALGVVSLPSRIYDRNGVLIGEFFTERRTLIPYEKIPKHVIHALIASEDRRFFQHEGVNFFAILRAFVNNLLELRFAQGGSTITQQLAKVFFTNQEKTVERKIYEYFCARAIERGFTKTEILEMYLNLIYMGHGNYGIEAASQFYFNKPAEKLSLAEGALLIGLLPNPKNYSPIHNLERSLEKAEKVLESMVEVGYLDKKTKKVEWENFLRTWKVSGKGEAVVSQIGNFPEKAYRINLAPYFIDHIRQKLLQIFSADVLNSGGLKIYTTIDYERQRYAVDALKESLLRQDKFYEEQAKLARKKNLPNLAQDWENLRTELNGAFISIEPKTGYILSMVGGREYSSKNMFNRAIKAKRQIGSLMKPFVYYLAISQKALTPASIMEDTVVKVGNFTYENYDKKYAGKITLRQALKQSKNTTAIRALQMVGHEELRRFVADTLDIPEREAKKRIPAELGVALGTSLFTPLEVALMYGALVNHGRRVIARDLLRVEDKQGKIIWQEEDLPPEIQVLDPVAAYITITMMQGVFEADGTAGWVAPLRQKDPQFLPFEVAGKTGTTSDYVDAWFAGLTSDEVTVIWVGNDNNASLGPARSGSVICSPAYVSYIRQSRKNLPPPPFRENWLLEGVVYESFCASSGGVPRKEDLCPDLVKDQVFFAGTEPKIYDSRDVKNEETLLPVP